MPGLAALRIPASKANVLGDPDILRHCIAGGPSAEMASSIER